MAETMTRAEKTAAMAQAWAEYRAASRALPVALPYSGYKRRDGTYCEGFLEQDERLWRRYLAAERSIAAIPETKAA